MERVATPGRTPEDGLRLHAGAGKPPETSGTLLFAAERAGYLRRFLRHLFSSSPIDVGRWFRPPLRSLRSGIEAGAAPLPFEVLGACRCYICLSK